MNPKIKLFLISLLILFLELSLIRWISANIVLAGFFSNLVILATFFGMGVGVLLAKKKFDLIYFFPYLLILLVGIVILMKVEVVVPSSDILFFKEIRYQTFKVIPEVLLPLIFLLVSLVFITLSQELGRLFTQFKPLLSYSLDIFGSLIGIILFSMMSFFSLPAYLWFISISLLGLILLPKKNIFLYFLSLVVLTLTCLIVFLNFHSNQIWTPYYKLTVDKYDDTYAINANNIAHQFISDYKIREPLYFLPYQIFNNINYKNVLIIGAGNGNDVATALGEDPVIESIDAVEIDPKIAELGKNLNPNKPYQDSRVHLHIDDGRAFLTKSNKKYDLIIYALTDSLTLTTQASNIRLESFLFTKESFQLAKEHLSSDGVLVLYNFYRRPWLVDKIALTLADVFGEYPHIANYGGISFGAIFLAGPKTTELKNNFQLNSKSPIKFIKSKVSREDLPISEDDWPFVYLDKKAIPIFYLKVLGIILLLSILILKLSLNIPLKKILFPHKFLNLSFFFLGAGFMLLETKSLVTFSLLFGTTWYVNSLVISGILMMVLLANMASNYIQIKKKRGLYIILFSILVLNFLIPVESFLRLESTSRYIIACLFYFTPIFIAGLIFSQKFKDSLHSDFNFGSNLLGALFGGLVEYTSLILGYKMLYLFVGIFYILSLINKDRS